MTPRNRLGRILAGHPRVLFSLALGVAVFAALPARLGSARAVIAWDSGTLAFLALSISLFCGKHLSRMAENAAEQQEGEWTVFWIALGAVLFSLDAIFTEFVGLRGLPPTGRRIRAALVIGTLLLSWLAIHTLFAYRYAHEYYERSKGGPAPDRGLDFPEETRPDYWDFLYFALVLGMTFQVSDVQITSRKLRRLATVHSLVSFVFNTVLLALSVNIGSGLL